MGRPGQPDTVDGLARRSIWTEVEVFDYAIAVIVFYNDRYVQQVVTHGWLLDRSAVICVSAERSYADEVRARDVERVDSKRVSAR